MCSAAGREHDPAKGKGYSGGRPLRSRKVDHSSAHIALLHAHLGRCAAGRPIGAELQPRRVGQGRRARLTGACPVLRSVFHVIAFFFASMHVLLLAVMQAGHTANVHLPHGN